MVRNNGRTGTYHSGGATEPPETRSGLAGLKGWGSCTDKQLDVF